MPRTVFDDLNLTGHTLSGLRAAVNADEAVRLDQLTSISPGLDLKTACRVAYAGELPTYTFAANQLTATANGSINPIDGSVTVIVGDRVLIAGELGANSKYNGIYVVTQVGSGGTPWILTRAADFTTSAQVTAGTFCFVEEGDHYRSRGFILSATNPIVLNTTLLPWSQFTGLGEVTTGTGLSKSFDTLNVDPTAFTWASPRRWGILLGGM